ncbi:MAG: ABC transporter substrate-binding protein [Candidatus Methylomirabilales bacterium]
MRLRAVGFIVALTLGVLASPPAVGAQQPAKVPRVGFLGLTMWGAPYYEALWHAMREFGYVDYKNIVFERRDAGGDPILLRDHATELARLKVDVIVVESTPAALAAKNATSTIPIVFIAGDPVGSGLVKSSARPGGNITGLDSLTPELTAKRLELLKEAAPKVSRVAVLWESADRDAVANQRETEVAGRALRVKLLHLEVRAPGEIERAYATMANERADALIVTTVWDPLGYHPVRSILDFPAKHRLPAIYPWRRFVEAGGLMSYGLNFTDLLRRTATYVDKILKGANPGDLPVEQPTKFDLVINLKTAKALGLRIPQSVLIRADEVIE